MPKNYEFSTSFNTWTLGTCSLLAGHTSRIQELALRLTSDHTSTSLDAFQAELRQLLQLTHETVEHLNQGYENPDFCKLFDLTWADPSSEDVSNDIDF